jgi:Lon protease-like protein
VLFPGALLPLHIFEPRYRQLLADLTAPDIREPSFGLLPPGESSELPPAGTVGCAGQLRGMQRLPDGRANIVISGERRFEFLAEAIAETPYHQGMIRWIGDAPDTRIPTDEDLARLHHLGVRYLEARQAMLERPLEIDLPTEPAALTFAIAGFLEWDFDALQHFLGIRSATERVTRLLSALPGLVAGAELRAVTHQRARTNGRGTLH